MAASRKPRGEIAPSLLAAAAELLEEEGHAEFSLRAVSGRANVPASAVTYHFGSRDGLARAVFAQAVAAERRLLETALEGVAPLDEAMLGDFLHDGLLRRIGGERRHTVVLLEALALVMRDPDAQAAIADLLDAECRFLAALCPALDRAAQMGLVFWLMGELPCWLVLADDPAFRLASAESARRAVPALQGKPLPAGGDRWWRRYRTDPVDTVEGPPLDGTKLAIADAVADIVYSRGYREATYRQVAKRAGVSMSSLLHHFGNGEAMIRAGYQQLFRNVNRRVRQWAEERKEGRPAESFGEIVVRSIQDGHFQDRMSEIAMALLVRKDSLLMPLVVLTRRQRGAITCRMALGWGAGEDERAAYWPRAEISSLCSSGLMPFSGAITRSQGWRPLVVALFDRLSARAPAE